MDEIGEIVDQSGENLTVDQPIAIAQAHAVLSLAQAIATKTARYGTSGE